MLSSRVPNNFLEGTILMNPEEDVTLGMMLSFKKKYPNVKRIGPDMNKEERDYLKKLLVERLTGKRIILHSKRNAPDIAVWMVVPAVPVENATPPCAVIAQWRRSSLQIGTAWSWFMQSEESGQNRPLFFFLE